MKRPLALLFSALVIGNSPGDDSWPRFRGPDGAGISAAKVPTELGEKSLLWSAPLPGPGSSSPSIRGNHIFVTGEDRKKHTVSLRCLDARDGKILWTKSLEVGDYHLHQYNNTASTSPAVNHELVIVSWYSGTKKLAILSAYDHSGKHLWDFEIGAIKTEHGANIHPVIHEDRVIICNLHQDGGYVGAISIKDGKEIWKTAYPGDKTSYVTPLIRKVHRPDGPGYEIIVTSQSVGVIGLDLKDGKEQWSVPNSMKQRTIVSPIDVLKGSGREDSLIAVGCKSGVYFTVRPPSLKGDHMSEPEIAWKMKGNTPYVPTPVSDGTTVYSLSDGGALVALDALTGEVRWKEQLPANFYASPLLIGGRLYALSREGEMFVADVKQGYQEVARSPLNPGPETKWADATPAVSGSRIFVRLGSRLDCYGQK
ncbi:PQQ-binding-like beta-propeller repeat protein [Verrucomicrobiaceae bacterium 227]